MYINFRYFTLLASTFLNYALAFTGVVLLYVYFTLVSEKFNKIIHHLCSTNFTKSASII